MHVSIIIPARNAAETLAETLRSVSDQTFGNWEAIVVDDGSTDQTAEIVRQHATRDSRFRLVQQNGAGVSLARNWGIELARFDHLLFLDADDFILPAHLARLSELLHEDPQLDAAVCGWAHVTPAAEFVFEQREGECGDLFHAHAAYCYSLIHTYLMRRAIVEEAGGFDPAFETCEDWDLFQRIARSGARFGRVSDVLAGYRMRAGSATSNVQNVLRDGLTVIGNGHGPDARVKRSHSLHSDGMPARELPRHAYGHACTCAGYMLGAGLNANSTLNPLPDPPPEGVSPVDAANAIFIHTMVAAARPRAEWTTVWKQAQPQLRLFLSALESRLGQPGFAHRTRLIADYLLQQSLGKIPLGTPAGAMCVAGNRLVNRLSGASKFTRRVLSSTFRSISILERPGIWLKRIQPASRTIAAEDAATHFEALFTKTTDPWHCENAYETTKARQALDLLPDLVDKHALEIGCAEGHMTRQLAARVKMLHATDISDTALERAARRCADLGNVEFRRLDLMMDPVGGPYDLIICSEVLYYIPDRKALHEAARRLAGNLRCGGYLLMVHANMVCDDPDSPGFAWGHPFGAKTIGAVFAETNGLTMLREAHAPLYRIHLLQRRDHGESQAGIETLTMADPLPSEIASEMRCGASRDMPILAYPLMASDDRPGQPDLFGNQMRALYSVGYRTQSFENWKNARDYGIPIAGRALHVVFDQASNGLVTKALPILIGLGFDATCFLTVDPLRGRLVLPAETGSSGLLNWRELRRLQASGMSFGVCVDDRVWDRHRSVRDLVRLVTKARSIVLAEVAVPVAVLRIPGSLPWTRRLQWIAGVCGFEFALGGRTGVAIQADPLLALPTLAGSVSCSPDALLDRLGASEGEPVA